MLRELSQPPHTRRTIDHYRRNNSGLKCPKRLKNAGFTQRPIVCGQTMVKSSKRIRKKFLRIFENFFRGKIIFFAVKTR